MYNSNSGFTSDLINSYAWDTAIIFIQKCSGDADYYNKGVSTSSVYTTGELTDEECHISDMAKNVQEWTTESCTFYDEYEGSFPWTYRRAGKRVGDSNYGGENKDIGFRPIIYIN